MKHLSDAEIADAAEGTLPPVRAAHLDGCDRCRTAVNALAAALREASAVDAPEPSPLFWDHFSARVHDAVAAEEIRASSWGWKLLGAGWAPAVAPVAVCALVVVVASLAWLARPHSSAASATMARAGVPGAAAPAESNAGSSTVEAAELSATDDPAWTVLNAAAEDVNVDDARPSEFAVRPAAVDNAVLQLTPAERKELGRLLRSELKRASN